MPVTVYRSTDTSAPLLTGQAGSLINVFDACLVNGYGDKTSMGQTKEYSGTNQAVYKMKVGTSQNRLSVDDTGTNVTRQRGFKTVTSVGLSEMNGVNPFPKDLNMSGGSYVVKSTTADAVARPQIILTDSSIFYLYMDTAGNYGGSGKIAVFGDIQSNIPNDPNPCILIGTHSNNGNYFCHLAEIGSVSNDHQLSQRYDGLATSIQCCKLPVYGYHTSLYTMVGSGNFLMPTDPFTGGEFFTPLQISEPTIGSYGIIRGILPGVQLACSASQHTHGDSFTILTGEMAGKTFEVLKLQTYISSWTNVQLIFETSNTQYDKKFS